MYTKTRPLTASSGSGAAKQDVLARPLFTTVPVTAAAHPHPTCPPHRSINTTRISLTHQPTMAESFQQPYGGLTAIPASPIPVVTPQLTRPTATGVKGHTAIIALWVPVVVFAFSFAAFWLLKTWCVAVERAVSIHTKACLVAFVCRKQPHAQVSSKSDLRAMPPSLDCPPSILSKRPTIPPPCRAPRQAPEEPRPAPQSQQPRASGHQAGQDRLSEDRLVIQGGTGAGAAAHQRRGPRALQPAVAGAGSGSG